MRDRYAALALALLVAGCATATDTTSQETSDGATSTASSVVAAAPPTVEVTELLTGLNKPWDVAVAPDGTILTGQRGGGFVALRPDGSVTRPTADLSDLYVSRETGLMGIALDPGFESNRRVFTCQGHRGDGQTDVRLLSWTVDPEWTALTRTGVVLAGLPSAGGRHAGCRILPAPDGTLFVGTGDATIPTTPQDPHSLGGKVLHIDTDGSPAAGNPDPASPVYTLGHRNVQGLSFRPGSGQLYSVEQGTHRDDEVNALVPAGNYGWRPDLEPGRYIEAVPMTDPDRVPGAREAVWSSGTPTLATASGSFLLGPGWGDWSGALAVGTQQGEKVLLLGLTPDGIGVERQAALLDGRYGRIRTVSGQPDGTLLVTTDNGSDDVVLRLTPRP
ncbi:glucose / Sorbosone dehydrogenase family protein [Rhodococcus sp. MTM3W5.2]|uniref:PQQ-dependent sugar dehydrogenase n=1 Tax=Rhodococcus sp. MTM3W5.2 TaxID=1805827 RepID=UPI00097958FB|nr:glucose / Sorbosone dehydrogenase family protein [Rhodococcus sp. MTM3W5.2]